MSSGVPEVIVVDFETEAIGPRPQEYPPRPAGVALSIPGHDSMYLAWAHPAGNNCDREHAERVLQSVYADGRPLLFHNGEFDMEVAQREFGLPLLSPERWHDSMLLAYLRDPHSRTLKLKELAEDRFNLPPDEQDAVRDWLIDNGVVRRNDKQWGARIADAPADVVGPYAIGDVKRTRQLFAEDYLYVHERGMGAAYEREKRLIPILLRSTQEGVRVDVDRLAKEVPQYEKQLDTTDAWLRKQLKTKDLNLDASEELADALVRSGHAREEDFLLTPKGARSVSKASLAHCLSKSVALRDAIAYREALNTCLGTFMSTWYEMGARAGGVVHVNWNATRQDQRGRGGTRTGRLSSTPNFQNIYADENLEKVETAALAKFKQWLPLPRVRGYVVADTPNSLLLDRDYSQQELRVLAHYEDGAMREAYLQNPRLDLHEYATGVIKTNTGLELNRKATKTIAFGLIYGMGRDALAERLSVSIEEADRAKWAYLDTFPGIQDLMKDLKSFGRRQEAMRTWGGREYHAEPSRLIDGQMKDYSYKLVNYLIQGSSADITKEAIIRYNESRVDGRFILTVHDQIVVSAPRKAAKEEMKRLQEAMNGIELSVPLLSDGAIGYRWTNMEEVND